MPRHARLTIVIDMDEFEDAMKLGQLIQEASGNPKTSGEQLVKTIYSYKNTISMIKAEKIKL